jgi:hypothetical protein
MASSIISFPNLDKLIYYNSKYLKPVINKNDYAYFILNNTDDVYLLNNKDPTNKLINVEAFVVGGGGAGGYYNGNGGDGGTVIYKSFTIDPNITLELSVGKGAFYVTDNTYNNGFQVKLYEGYIIDFFETQKSYLMNMKPIDTITNGLNKMWEQKVNSISSLKTIVENDVDSEIITNINQNELCRNNPNSENCENAIKTMFAYNKGFTFNIYSVFFAPFDCEIEIEITAFKYAILFFYSDDDVKNKLFDNDLTLYQTFSNNYYMKINNETKKFKRGNIKAGEQYYLKIVYTQDKELSSEESKFNVNINLKSQNGLTNANDYFKFNNSSDNFGIIYASSSTIYNKNKKVYEVNALGGITGNVNLDTVNYGKGGCATYQLATTKKVKVCGDNTNGATGATLPVSFDDLKEEPYNYSYTYGSGGGGAFWRLNGYGGNGGKDAGNGISFTNLPSISRPTINTGGGGGANSFLTNYSEKMLNVNKLSGANGIIILKVSKKTEQALIQTFVNKNTDNSEIEKINVEIEKLYKENKIDNYTAASFPDLLPTGTAVATNKTSDNFRFIIKHCLSLFTCLYVQLLKYTDPNILNEKERLKYPIKIIYNRDKPALEINGGICIINVYISNDANNANNANNEKIINNTSPTNYNYYTRGEIVYNPNFEKKSLLISNTEFAKYYITNLLNTVVDNNRLVIFIESVVKNYLYYYKLSVNTRFYDSLKALFAGNKTVANVIGDINVITNEVKTVYNDILFNPVDYMSNGTTDLLTNERSDYIDKQNKFKETSYNNSVKLITSNNVTNYSINNFKTKYKLNKNDKFFNIAFYVFIVIIIIVFIYTYAYFEVPLRPLVLLILLVVIFIIIGLLWLKATYDLKIYENFTCSVITANPNPDTPINSVTCKDKTGTDIASNNLTIPYYFISNGDLTTTSFKLKPASNLYVDIFMYGAPRVDNTTKYYLPDITIYKNVLLTSTFNYNIYNNRITRFDESAGINESVLFSIIEQPTIATTYTRYLKIYDCQNKRKDLCSSEPIITPFTFTSTTLPNTIDSSSGAISGKTTTGTIPEILAEYYDFDPPTGNSLYPFGRTGINTHVLQQPFIVIKVTNDSIDTTETIDETINKFKREMNLFEINSSLFLLNKNTKKIVDFTKQYHKYNNQQYADAYLTNSQIYDKNQQAYYILNREIMYGFYSKLLIAIIIAIVLCCFMLYHFNNALKIHIIVLSFIAITIAVSVIFYKVNKRQHRDTDKYYFAKPDNYR